MRQACLVLVCISLCVSAAWAGTVGVETGSDWKSWNVNVPGWNAPGFDDSSWRNAYAGYTTHPDPTAYPELATAATIWDWPGPGIPDGLNGPIQAYFRKEVYLGGPVTSALYSYVVDDNANLYVNGTAAYLDYSNGANGKRNLAIDTSLFQVGWNTIAIYALDGGYGQQLPRNRGGEGLTARLEIETNVVPLPSGLLLAGIGLLTLAGVRRLGRR